jgi:hypothetical protein
MKHRGNFTFTLTIVLVEKRIIAQMVKDFLAFYGTRSFTTVKISLLGCDAV